MAQVKNIGIWIRVSTEDQAKGESPQHHEERGRAYAKINDWEITTVYHLEGVSGKSVMQHPEAQRMMQDIKSGKITGLIFSKLARLARSTKELLEFSEFFRTYSADLISLQEKIDTSSPAGRLFYTIIAAMAQWEREEIADRVAASIPIRAKLGKNLGGAAPYGYVWNEGVLHLDEKEAAVRKRIFEYFAEHKRKKYVAKLLNEQGCRTRNGSLFTNTTITRLLQDPLAKGMRRANYTKSLGQGKNWEFKPKETWVFTEAPAIVNEELWQKCNDILDEMEIKNKRPARNAVHLFGGLTFCHCGEKMYVKSNNPKYICNKCHNKIPTGDLEEIFYEELKTYLFSREEIGLVVSQTERAISEKEKTRISLVSEMSDLQLKLQNLLDLHQTKQIPTEGFSEHYKPLYEQLKQKEAYSGQLLGEIDAFKMQCRSTEEVFTEAQDLHSQWKVKSPEEKRAIIEDITHKIIIDKQDLEIILKGIPRTLSLKLMAKREHNFRGSCWPPT